MKPKSRTRYEIGLRAETLCRIALRLKGWRIIAKRYRAPMGETDIIACRGKTLALIEVKARKTAREAIEAVLPRQQARISRAASDFLTRNPRFGNHNVRFDVMLVAKGWPHIWPKHIPDAWRPDSC
jgi:putative endonuclease